MASSLKKQIHPGKDATAGTEAIPGRPNTTRKKTDWTDGDADSGFGIPDHKRKKQHKSSQADIGAYPSGHETLCAEYGAKSKGPRNPLKERGYEKKY
jgi:hypothetical protein